MTDLPQPLTPADCDLKDFKFMPLDVARLRDSDMASEQTPEENWAAVLLWSAAWHQVPAASMPDSDNWIAKAAGYMMRGRIDPRWKDVKAGAMRGFILCDDGRWYHPVVAEKANESWIGKLKQRLKTECARIKKHNDRHGTAIPFPDFDTWMSSGCPLGQPLSVPRDTPPLSLDEIPPVPTKTPSKGQGEGQGEGQLTSKDGIDDATYGDREDDDRLPPRPQHGAAVDPTSRATEIATWLRAAGITKVTSFNPDVAVTWAQDDRVTDQMLADAVALAKEAKGDAPIPVGYLKPIIAELLNPPEAKPAKAKDDWEWVKSDSGIQRKANELGIRAHGNMSYRDLADKCKTEIQNRKRTRS